MPACIAIAFFRITVGVAFLPAITSSVRAFHNSHIILQKITICSSYKLSMIISIVSTKFNGKAPTLRTNCDMNRVNLDIGQKNSMCIIYSLSCLHLGHIALNFLILLDSSCVVAKPPCNALHMNRVTLGIIPFHFQIFWKAFTVCVSYRVHT